MQHPSDDTPGSPQQLGLWHLTAAVVVLIVPLVIVVSRMLACRATFDGFSLALVLVALLPPLSMFFVRIKLPGIQVDTYARESTVKIEDQAREVKTALPLAAFQPYSPGLPAKKVLATLHRYQQQLFANEPDKRWTFIIGAKSPAYNDYKQGVDELIERGVGALTPDGHVYLTSEGLETAKALASELASSPHYQF
jgi:hypothetical protein